MPLDQARWQIDILAADKTAQAFASVQRRMRALEVEQARIGQSMGAGALVATRGFSALGGAIARLAPLLAPVTLAWATWNAGMKSGAMIDRAEQIGLTIEAMQAYHLVALQSGVGTEQFDGALQRLTAAMGAAKGGSDEAIARFDRLGVKLLDAEGNLRGVNDVLPEVARGLLGVGSETERNALAQELFGRTGQRLVTMLNSLALGSDALTLAAERNGAIVGRDTADAWNKLDSQLKIARTSADAALAALGAPIATVAMEAVNKILTDILANLGRLKAEAATASQSTAQRAAAGDVLQLEDQLAAARQRLAFNPRNTMAQAEVAALEKRIATAQRAEQLARQATMAAEEDFARRGKLDANFGLGGGKSQPTPNGGKTGGGAGERDRVREAINQLQGQARAADKALADMMAGTSLPLDALERNIQLEKKIADEIAKLGKYDPKDPRVGQIRDLVVQHETAESAIKRYVQASREAEQVEKQLGDGRLYLRDEMHRLGEALDTGRLSYEAYAVATRAARDRGEEMRLTMIGQQESLAGIMAGIEYAGMQWERNNRAFQTGQRIFTESTALMSQALTDLVSKGEADFGRLLGSFANMLAQMAAQAAASGLFNLASSALTSLFSAGVGAAMSPGQTMNTYAGLPDWYARPGFPARADGGPVSAGMGYIVNDGNAEVFFPGRSGTIVPSDEMEGGSSPVIIRQTMYFGSDVSRATLRTWGEQIKQETIAEVHDRRRRNDASSRGR